MSDESKQPLGSIAWADLTVENAERVRDFYAQVVCWGSEALDMGGYSDFCMTTPEHGVTVAGICRARGRNAGLPRQWLLYVLVEDIDRSLAACQALGGRALTEVRNAGFDGRYCVIEDPAGAVFAIYQKAA